jgi:hypothetical protein
MRTKRRARQKEQTFHHSIYVILLRDAVAKHPSILLLNPKRDRTEALHLCGDDRTAD